MMSQASRAGDMPSDIKLRYCTKIADECLLRKLSKQARHAHAFQPITATAHSNHSSSDTGKQPAQKEYYNGLEVCRNFCRGQCKSSNCKFSHPPGRGRSASYTAAGQKSSCSKAFSCTTTGATPEHVPKQSLYNQCAETQAVNADCRVQQEQASSTLSHPVALHQEQDESNHSKVFQDIDPDSLSDIQLEADTDE
ncbi:TPA: hypothetical protein ACH3X1_009886 [Trebouxia sp. C0004]